MHIGTISEPGTEPEASKDSNPSVATLADAAQQAQIDGRVDDVPIYQEVVALVDQQILHPDWLESEPAERVHGPSLELAKALFREATEQWSQVNHQENLRSTAFRLLRPYQGVLRSQPAPEPKPQQVPARKRWNLPPSLSA